MSLKSNRENQAAFQAKKAQGGLFRRRSVWVHPDDYKIIRELEDRLRALRIKQLEQQH